MVDPRPEILTMPGYTPGRSVDLVARERGLTDVIKLASNESAWGTSPNVRQAAVESLSGLYQYPEVIPEPLIAELVHHSGFAPDQLLLGNGADELLRLVATIYLRPGDRVLYPLPSFAAYPYDASLMAAEGVPIALHRQGHMDLDAFADAIDSQTRLIYLCSPNNPTGGIFRHDQWEQFIERVDDRAVIVVDQAYREFVDDPAYARVEDAIQAGRPVVMVRTFSKLYGLAGARIGWMAAPPQLIDWARRVREPFSLNAVAIASATQALRDAAYFSAVRSETLELRTWLAQQLVDRGYPTLPSQANFLTFDCGMDAGIMADAIEQHGVIIRPTTSFGLPNHCRVSIAPKAQLQRFLDALDRARVTV